MIILFDLDGTLIDSTEAIVNTFHHAFNVHGGVQPSDEAISALIGYPLDVMFANLGADESKVWDYVYTYKERYRQISTLQTKLLDCATKAVEGANEIATLGIVTTKTGEYSRVLMEHFGLMHYFGVLIGREDVQNPKPDAEPILKAMQALNYENQEVWMIGDTKLDLIAATNAKINSIGVVSGYDEKEVLLQYTDIVLNDALEAVEFLKTRIKQNQRVN